MSWISKALHRLTTLVAGVWRTVAPKIKDDFERFASEFADVAMTAIQEQALQTISGQAKLSNAADVVLKTAEAAGWRLLKTAAVTLVQDVYTATKAQAGPLVAPPDDEAAAAAFDDRVANPHPNE